MHQSCVCYVNTFEKKHIKQYDCCNCAEYRYHTHYLCLCLQDPRALKRLLDKEDIRELPSDVEPWAVPEPEVHLERGEQDTVNTSIVNVPK